jgi:hypothetical protein
MYDTTGAQVAWIKADLAANTRKWTIAYWHHPPYTMGSHNSNSEGDLIDIREKIYPHTGTQWSGPDNMRA